MGRRGRTLQTVCDGLMWGLPPRPGGWGWDHCPPDGPVAEGHPWVALWHGCDSGEWRLAWGTTGDPVRGDWLSTHGLSVSQSSQGLRLGCFLSLGRVPPALPSGLGGVDIGPGGQAET